MKKLLVVLAGTLLLVGGGCVKQATINSQPASIEQKTYTNTLGKYTFTYPNNVLIEGESSDELVTDKNAIINVVMRPGEKNPDPDVEGNLVVSFRQLKTNFYPEHEINLLRQDYFRGNKNIKVEPFKLNNWEGWQLTNQGQQGKGMEAYRVVLLGQLVIVEGSPSELSDSIVQTLKFIK